MAWKIHWLIGILLCGSLQCWGAVIQGKVTDAQGRAIADVSIEVRQADSSFRMAVLTGENGSYSLGNLPPGTYTLRASKAGYADSVQGPIPALQDTASVVVNFRISQSGESEVLRGAEERNPNDFIIRLDTNAIQNELSRVGASLRYFPEFRSDRSYYGEQFGYPLRSVELASHRRPLQGFHGSFYEFHNNNALDARPFFQVGSLKPSRRNQYGFSVSVPILSEKLSFRFAWGQIRDSGFVNGNVQVPLANERKPRTEDPVKNAIIAAYLNGFSEERPNRTEFTPRHLNTNARRDIRNTAFSLHLDYQPRSTDQIAYDQQFSDYSQEPFELVAGQNPETLLRPQSHRLSYSHSFSPQTISRLAFNYDRLRAILSPTTRYRNLLMDAGIEVVPDVELGDELTNLGMPQRGIPIGRFENHFLFSSQMSHNRGRHALSMGFSWKRLQDNDLRSDHIRKTLSFRNDFGRTAVENFLLGKPSRMFIGIGNRYVGSRNWEYAFYLQDRFTVSPSFFLNLGIRYEILTAPRDVTGRIRFLFGTDANNFAPAFGFAWNPGQGNTVIRGGYGVTFGTISVATYSRQRSNPPNSSIEVVAVPDLLAIREVSSPEVDPDIRANKNNVGPDLVVPYSHMYNLAVERELPANTFLRIGYLGSRTFKMFTGAVFNRAQPVPGIPATSATVNQRRPDPRFLRIYNIINSSIGYLDALQVTVNKRRSRGLAFQARYAFSKAIDTSGHDFTDIGSGADVSQTSELFADLKGPSRFDTPHSFSVSYSYEVPAGLAGQGFLSFLLGKWTVSGTTIFRSGTPFSVFTGSDAPGFGNVDGESKDRPNLLHPGILGASVDYPDTATSILRPEYFDTNLPVGGRGNLGYRTFRKDGTNNWNLALTKSFPLSAADPGKQLQFRVAFFNFLNHAQFSAPGSSVSSPTFGKITNTVNKGRVTQLMLRLLF